MAKRKRSEAKRKRSGPVKRNQTEQNNCKTKNNNNNSSPSKTKSSKNVKDPLKRKNKNSFNKRKTDNNKNKTKCRPKCRVNIGCKHYKRNCFIYPSCCPDLLLGCRHCHNETQNHKMDRFKTERIQCMICKTDQKVSNKCINPKCQTVFSTYFCKICRLWDSTPNKNLYHCDKCKMCRVRSEEGSYHCDICDTCVKLSFKDSHICRKNKIKDDCCICLESLFESIQPLAVLDKCGHVFHDHCLEKCKAAGQLRCPLCREYMVDLTPALKTLIDQGVENFRLVDPQSEENQPQNNGANNDIDGSVRNQPIEPDTSIRRESRV